MKQNEAEGVQPLRKPKDCNVVQRKKQKARKQRNCATKGGFIAPIIIPSTPNSELLNILKEVAKSEAEPGLKFRLVEQWGGRAVESVPTFLKQIRCFYIVPTYS